MTTLSCKKMQQCGCFIIVISLATACGSTERPVIGSDIELIERLVAGICRAGGIARLPVEKAAGVRLHLFDQSRYFRSYDGTLATFGQRSLTLTLREPIPGSGAAAGVTLTVGVSGGCTSRSALQARFGPLRLTDLPHGRSLDEQSYWTSTESWGGLSFGFAEAAPACLRSVVFTMPGPR